jgi:hypothetical protein
MTPPSPVPSTSAIVPSTRRVSPALTYALSRMHREARRGDDDESGESGDAA